MVLKSRIRASAQGQSCGRCNLIFRALEAIRSRTRMSLVRRVRILARVHEGELSAVRFGRSYRVPAQAFQKYLIAEWHTTVSALNPATT